MSGTELTKEQLLDYVKKQKIKIKKLETEIVSLKAKEEIIHQEYPEKELIHSNDSKVPQEAKTSVQVETLLSEKETLENLILSLKNELQTTNNENKHLNNTIESLRLEIFQHSSKVLSEHVDQTTSNLVELQAKNEHLFKAWRDSQEQLERLTLTIKGTIIESETSPLEDQSTINKLEKIISHMFEREEYAKKCLNNSNEKIREAKELQEKVYGLIEQLSEREKAISRLQTELTIHNKITSSSNEDALNQTSFFEGKIINIELEKELLERQLSLLTQEKTSLIDQHEQLLHKYHAFEQIKVQQKLELDSLFNEKQHYLGINKQLHEQVSSLTSISNQYHQLLKDYDIQQIQLQQLQQDFKAQEEKSNEKIKKLKLLLNRVNTSTQEKEKELKTMETLTKRPKRFMVLTRILVKQTISDQSSTLWCLIFIDNPPSDASTSQKSNSFRWVEASVMEDWLSQGSTLIGSLPPRLDEEYSAIISNLQLELQREKEESELKYQDISEQFRLYKLRAQTALKRIGAEDVQRQKHEQVEHEQIVSLKQEKEKLLHELNRKAQIIEEISRKYEDSMLTLENQQNISSELTKQIESEQKRINEKENIIQELENQIEELKIEKAQLASALEKKEKSYDLLKQQSITMNTKSTSEHSEGLSHHHHHQPIVHNVNESLNPVLALPVLERSDTIDNIPPDLTLAKNSNTLISQLSNRLQVISPNLSLSLHSTSSDPIVSPTIGNISSHSKLLVHQQTEHLLKHSLHALRDENANYAAEIMELRNDINLREEQIATLKTAVRELEASIIREQEFNASNRRLNAEYLVNVIKRFLMDDNASERAKLVSVICNLLHLPVDESRIITEKWVVKGGGLVGWFLPKAPTISSSSLKGSHGQNNNHSEGDLTYDPVTGGGLDFPGY